MDQRESIGSTIIKSERINKPCESNNKLISDLYVIANDIVERWSQSLISLSDLSNDISLRTPDVIKKELKHAKNPMEIKRLNKELTAYYKDHKKCKGGSK